MLTHSYKNAFTVVVIQKCMDKQRIALPERFAVKMRLPF